MTLVEGLIKTFADSPEQRAEKKRKKDAAGRVAYGNVTAETAPTPSVGATGPVLEQKPTGRLALANPAQAAFYAPDTYDQVQRHNAQFDATPGSAEQARQQERVTALFRNNTGNNIFNSNVTDEHAEQMGGRPAMVSANQFGGYGKMRSEIGDRAAIGTGIVGDTAANAALNQGLLAEQALKEAQEGQRQDIGTQKARTAIANLKQNQAADQVSFAGNDELMKNEQLVRDLAMLRARDQETKLVYGERPALADPGWMTVDINGNLTETKNPYYDNPMASMNPLASAAGSIGMSRKGLTTRGAVGGNIPTPARLPQVTGKEMYDRLMRLIPAGSRPTQAPQTITPTSTLPVTSGRPDIGMTEAVNTFRQPIGNVIDRFNKHMGVYDNPVAPIAAPTREEVKVLADKRRVLQASIMDPKTDPEFKKQLLAELAALQGL